MTAHDGAEPSGTGEAVGCAGRGGVFRGLRAPPFREPPSLGEASGCHLIAVCRESAP